MFYQLLLETIIVESQVGWPSEFRESDCENISTFSYKFGDHWKSDNTFNPIKVVSLHIHIYLIESRHIIILLVI